MYSITPIDRRYNNICNYVSKIYSEAAYINYRYKMSTNKYKYSTINEMVKDGDYNFYGIIYDASFPLQEENPQNTYVCYLKLNCLVIYNI